MRKNKHFRKGIKKLTNILLAICIIVLGGCLAHHFNVRSVNDNAKKYKSGSCIAFYPETQDISFVENLCYEHTEDKDKFIVDYEVVPQGDYLYIKYGETGYLLDNNYHSIQISELNEKAKMIMSDYLRNKMKSLNMDVAYTSKFMEDTYFENMVLEDYHFDKNNFVFCNSEYEVEVEVPLKYIAKELNMNVGINNENYIHKPYINQNRKMVALTFDDGPSLSPECTDKLLNELYKYDAVGNFFVVGNHLYEDTENLIKKGISLGNEYGSHSCTHADLKTLSKEQIDDEIMSVVDWFKEKQNYEVKMYRPPYGSYNQMVDETIPLPAILWDVDSEDWRLKDADKVVNEIGDIHENTVILCHDIHPETVEAMVDKGLIRDIINQGFQLVKIDDIAQRRNIPLKQGTHLCWD